MSEEKSLAIVDAHALDRYAFEPGGFGDVMQLADVIHRSGLVPHVKSAQAAAAIMMWGRTLGLGAMQSFSGIYVVQGTPALHGWLIVALVRRRSDVELFEHVEGDDKSCTWVFKRKGRPEKRLRYTRQQADDAGYTTRYDKEAKEFRLKDNWAREPESMLSWRCATKLAKREVPETLGGFSEVDEVADFRGAVKDVQVAATDDGAVEPEVVEDFDPGELQRLSNEIRGYCSTLVMGDEDGAEQLHTEILEEAFADRPDDAEAITAADIAKARDLARRCQLGAEIVLVATSIHDLTGKSPAVGDRPDRVDVPKLEKALARFRGELERLQRAGEEGSTT